MCADGDIEFIKYRLHPLDGFHLTDIIFPASWKQVYAVVAIGSSQARVASQSTFAINVQSLPDARENSGSVVFSM